jgi:kynurenine 3-monooxygenase
MSQKIADQKQTITLVGAGLVGSLLAVMLAKRGYKVEIFERRPDMRLETISAGRSINLALANRGIAPLEAAGLMQQVKPILIPMKGRMVHDLDGMQNFQSYGQKDEEVIYSVSRGELNKICMNAAEATGKVTIHFNQNCQQVDFDNNQLTLKHEISGEIVQQPFNRIIGTDGASSATRKAIHAKQSIQHDVISLGHSYKELQIPAGANGDFLLEKSALHIWPRGGFMVIALPNLDGSFTVTLFMPNEGDISFQSLKTLEQVDAFFKQYFANALALMPNLADDFFANPTGKLATVKCAPWHFKDQALLLGDAAHAIVPFHGQGMNCGFEDALALVTELDKAEHNWQTTFAQVDKLRKPNADAIADMAIDNYIIMRDSVRDEKFLLQNQLAFELENRFPQHFCPRYSMVMFHHMPYAEALTRGEIQKKILLELTQNISSLKQVDYAVAEQLVMQQCKPIDFNH